jgi:hypothetical protein
LDIAGENLENWEILRQKKTNYELMHENLNKIRKTSIGFTGFRSKKQ